MMPVADPPIQSLRVFITAAEAYPALEQTFLSAEREVWASFLVFDLSTRLRSPDARAVGETWFDLLVHTLRRGVSIVIMLADVDPIGRPKMHRAATHTQLSFLAAAELAGPSARLVFHRARHPAQTGLAIRLAVWPYALLKVWRTTRWLNGLAPDIRRAALREMPGAAANLYQRLNGTVRPKVFSLPRLYPATHHQKLAVFDRQLLYIGGLDLDERRFDTPRHARSGDQTWHDVQVMVTGSVAAEAQVHLETFRDVTAGQVRPNPSATLLRTLSRARRHPRWHFGPAPVLSDLRDTHFRLAKQSTRLIYLESQYFRDRGFARVLARHARRTPDLGLILILPAAPDDVAFEGRSGADARYGEAMQAAALKILRKGFGDRLFVGSPAQPRKAPTREPQSPNRRDRLLGAPLVYVHAKVSVFDTTTAIVSSANLNGRSLRWDTEAGVLFSDPDHISTLRQRVMENWLHPHTGPDALDPDTAVQVWARIARANARLAPPDRHGFLLPHNFAAAEAFGRNLPIVPEEMV